MNPESVSMIRSMLSPSERVPMREGSVVCAHPGGLHRMHYTEWGDADNPNVVICVHGLTRNGRDFDFLAREISDEFRVVCPDVVGRGKSQWLNEAGLYTIPLYVNDMVTLIARQRVEQVMWVGTSMGGLMGMALAALPDSPIHKLVLNDVGPVIDAAAIARIGEYVGRAPSFGTLLEAEQFLRELCASFGPLTDEHWRHITFHAVKPTESGGVELCYDPKIGDAFRSAATPTQVDLWPMYEAIRCPTLVLRGESSDLLSADTASQMSRRGPRARIVDIPGVGHAPMLMDDDQIALVAGFLEHD